MTANSQTFVSARAPKWWRWLIGFGTAWGLLLTFVASFIEPTPENLTLTAAIWFSGFYTIVLGLTRRWWLPRLTKHPLRNAVLLGAFNAAVIETIFLIFEYIFGAEGVAAHPNLIVDLIMTMPWYIMMCFTFVKVQNRWRFPTATVLFLGGIYEIGADGIVGQFMGILSGDNTLFTIEYWLMMAFMYLWAFIAVYSSMLLPSAWLIAKIPPRSKPSGSGFWSALKPLLWIFPFTIYLFILFFIIMVLSKNNCFQTGEHPHYIQFHLRIQ
ncbi:MAG: hypothetical protein JEZ00_04990 [Anaerolineaceae bacterium]|nr:hypothetical protein [Anaerolineaceae bacterium]